MINYSNFIYAMSEDRKVKTISRSATLYYRLMKNNVKNVKTSLTLTRLNEVKTNGSSRFFKIGLGFNAECIVENSIKISNSIIGDNLINLGATPSASIEFKVFLDEFKRQGAKNIIEFFEDDFYKGTNLMNFDYTTSGLFSNADYEAAKAGDFNYRKYDYGFIINYAIESTKSDNKNGNNIGCSQTFYASEFIEDGNVLTIKGYDAMLKLNTKTSLDFSTRGQTSYSPTYEIKNGDIVYENPSYFNYNSASYTPYDILKTITEENNFVELFGTKNDIDSGSPQCSLTATVGDDHQIISPGNTWNYNLTKPTDSYDVADQKNFRLFDCPIHFGTKDNVSLTQRDVIHYITQLMGCNASVYETNFCMYKNSETIYDVMINNRIHFLADSRRISHSDRYKISLRPGLILNRYDILETGIINFDENVLRSYILSNSPVAFTNIEIDSDCSCGFNEKTEYINSVKNSIAYDKQELKSVWEYNKEHDSLEYGIDEKTYNALNSVLDGKLQQLHLIETSNSLAYSVESNIVVDKIGYGTIIKDNPFLVFNTPTELENVCEHVAGSIGNINGNGEFYLSNISISHFPYLEFGDLVTVTIPGTELTPKKIIRTLILDYNSNSFIDSFDTTGYDMTDKRLIQSYKNEDTYSDSFNTTKITLTNKEQSYIFSNLDSTPIIMDTSLVNPPLAINSYLPINIDYSIPIYCYNGSQTDHFKIRAYIEIRFHDDSGTEIVLAPEKKWTVPIENPTLKNDTLILATEDIHNFTVDGTISIDPKIFDNFPINRSFDILFRMAAENLSFDVVIPANNGKMNIEYTKSDFPLSTKKIS